MNYTMLEEAKELAGWNAETEVLSMYTAMQQLSDARRAQGKRYPLALLLTYLLLAKAAGETTLQARSRVDSFARNVVARGVTRREVDIPLRGHV